MEQFSDLIKNRRSMRKFTGEEVNQEEVVTLLKAALMSPSSKRSNCWQFIAVDDKETLEKLSHSKEMGAAFLTDAALAIVVVADPLASDVWIEDAAIASAGVAPIRVGRKGALYAWTAGSSRSSRRSIAVQTPWRVHCPRPRPHFRCCLRGAIPSPDSSR